jgi:hypothetical protein
MLISAAATSRQRDNEHTEDTEGQRCASEAAAVSQQLHQMKHAITCAVDCFRGHRLRRNQPGQK